MEGENRCSESMADGHLFNVSLSGHGGTIIKGKLGFTRGVYCGKNQGGGKAVEFDKDDIVGLSWMKVPQTNQLGVRSKDGLYVLQIHWCPDVATLTPFLQSTCGITPEEKQLSVSAKNWGEVELNDLCRNMLTFLVGSRQALEKDSLMEISFHIPNTNTQFVGDENCPARVFLDKIMSMADVGAGGEESVVSFEGIAILTPWADTMLNFIFHFCGFRGKLMILKFSTAVLFAFFYCPRFETDYVVESTLSMNEDLFNTKYKDKLEPSYKVTRPGRFCSCQDGYAVKSSLKAEDRVLYPLEKGFFFLPKPPTLILHEEIDYVEFERHAAGGSNMHCFDLLIRLKTEQEHLFRNILRNEYHNLFDFIRKGLKIMNLGDIRTTDGVAAILQSDDDDDAVDPHLERIKNAAGEDESDEEDEDFVADRDNGGSPTNDSGEEESDASDSGGEKESKDGDEDGLKKRKQKKKKDPNAPKRALSGFMFFSQSEREAVPYVKACSYHVPIFVPPTGTICISSRERKYITNMKKINPGIAFTDVGRVLGDKWKKMTAAEKEPYEVKAQADKKRCKDEISGYKNPEPMNIDSGNESDSA
ncbi:unnamed protein product [Camellia sinensis]